MNCRLSLNLDEIVPQSEIEGLKIAAQDAMAVEFYGIVLNNFGPGEGENRPEEWPALDPEYALNAKDGDTTPTLILDGHLIASIDQSLGGVDYSSVFTDCEYADTHQWGGKSYNPYVYRTVNIPPRPFFPIIGSESQSELTEYAEAKCIAAAQKAIDSHL